VVLSAPACLPVRVLARVVGEVGLGELHPVLAPVPVWRSADERAPLPPALGWVDRRGALDREVAASLAVLCRPATACFGWITCGAVTTAVLAACLGKEAVLAVRTADDMVRLSRVPAARLAERLVAQTPDVPPVAGVPLVVALSELRAASPAGRVRAPGGVASRLADPAVRRVQRLLAQPTTGAGELYVDQRDEPVCYVDTAGGRVVVTALGSGMVRVGPADLVARLRGCAMEYR
jgi:hypothetical protein